MNKCSAIVALLACAGILSGIAGYVYFNKGQKNQVNISQKEALPDCFNPPIILATTTDTSKWKVFYGYRFSVKYPPEKVSIVSLGSEDHAFQIASLTGNHKATINIYNLKKDAFTAKRMNAESVTYEPYSNTWWFDIYVSSSSKFMQCHPNPQGMTVAKSPIYAVGDGDAGFFYKTYFLLRRDALSYSFDPLIVAITAYGDGNDPGIASFPEFNEIIENMVKTLELQEPPKG